jgi:hypothetical protein
VHLDELDVEKPRRVDHRGMRPRTGQHDRTADVGVSQSVLVARYR